VKFSTIAVSRTAPVAEIRLNRPDRGNPIDAQLLDEIDAAADEIDSDPAILVVLLTAEGEVFSHGWEDVSREAGAGLGHDSHRLPFRSLELLGQPVIACIEGDAVGAGLELALASDVRIAAHGVMFAVPDVAAGYMPSLGATQRLPRLAGQGVAASMILLGEAIDAERAFVCGLVNDVVPRADVRRRATGLAERIAAQGPLAVRYAKEAIVRGLDMPLDQALRYETDLTVILQTTEDRAEGVRAFVEKRKPNFEGR
jgi:enoyl-CoA hydratase